MPVRTKLILATIVLAIGLGGAMLFRRGSKQSAPEPTSGHTLPLRAGAGLGDFSARFENATSPAPPPTEKIARQPSQPVAATGARSVPPADAVTPPDLPPRYQNEESTSHRPGFETTADALKADSPQRQLPVAAGHKTLPRKHKVVDGDTLVTLSQRYLGRGDRYMDLFDANRSLLTDPDVLPIGLELVVPDRDAARPAAPVVANGDSALVPIPRGSLRRPTP